MESKKVKSILRLYRPEVDEETTLVTEALAEVENDPELKAWYSKHLQNEDAIHFQLSGIDVPVGLKEEINLQYSKKKVTKTRSPWLAPLAIAASLLLLVLSWGIFSPKESGHFADFQQDMVAFATQPYEMNIKVEGLELINQGFANADWPTNYVTPVALNSLHALGGVAERWQGEKVSIVCLEDDAGKYIWLFITKLNTFSNEKTIPLPAEVIKDKPLLTHTAWQDKQFNYYMIAEGDIAFINSYL
ncbi:hypothetical protein BIZ37_21060 [Photobacterium sp. BZF1]|uniref:hypothetical protein n=1 Tax=Photobacterium sp. BZF1 TaxID=1904457 RepID=UPI0016538443|nr:hypothetical protein [Photobacterium sp. BZF1]MBC7005058.1 hypothetical protein [Photobacterium sp. BZF1]